MHDKKLYGTATVGSKGQVVIPVDARESLGIQPGDRLYVMGSQNGQWLGLLKEEQLRVMVENLTEHIEQYSDLLNNKQSS